MLHGFKYTITLSHTISVVCNPIFCLLCWLHSAGPWPEKVFTIEPVFVLYVAVVVWKGRHPTSWIKYANRLCVRQTIIPCLRACLLACLREEIKRHFDSRKKIQFKSVITTPVNCSRSSWYRTNSSESCSITSHRVESRLTKFGGV